MAWMKKAYGQVKALSTDAVSEEEINAEQEMTAEQMWQEQLKYMPQQAQLAYDLAAKYTPLQLALELENAQKFMPEFQKLQEQLRSSDRAADIQDALTQAKHLQTIRESAEAPEVTQMRKTLLGQVNDELAMGSKLTDEQARNTAQGFRSAEASRGLLSGTTGGGTGSSAREAVSRALEGQNLQTQRQSKAQSVLGQEYAASPDPFLSILGRPSTATSAANAQYAAGMTDAELAGYSPQGYTVAMPMTSLELQQQIANQEAAVGLYGTATGYQTSQDQLSLQQQQLAMQQAQWEAQMEYIPQLYAQMAAM
jgi:hypothetical protein